MVQKRKGYRGWICSSEVHLDLEHTVWWYTLLRAGRAAVRYLWGDDVPVSRNLPLSHQGFFFFFGRWVLLGFLFSVPSPLIPSPGGHISSRPGKMRPTMTGMQDSCPFLTVLVGWGVFFINLQNSSDWRQLRVALLWKACDLWFGKTMCVLKQKHKSFNFLKT